MNPVIETLPDGHSWLRVADPSWADPLDPSYAREHGGRWNPPGSFPTLYLNEDLTTARAQISALLSGSPVEPDDLDVGFDLVVASLPRSQEVADAVTGTGLRALGLPDSYPRHSNGRPVRHGTCQPVGAGVAAAGLRGVHARSAATEDGSGRELAWFPARESSRATLLERLSFRDWWHRQPEITG
ncbi:MAG TPA: RES family NAD+ phosphorylase [Acidimicrobiia bacterium]|nr:RES family NAD+ phosphorylase [Acidimicrobiia bacterium]